MRDTASNGFKVQLHALPFIIANFSYEKTQCANVVGGRTLQNAVTKEIDFSGPATNINVEVGTMTIGNTLEMVAINDACFFAAVDDFDIDTRVFRNLANDGSAVFCITHGRGGTGAIIAHIVNLHKMPIGLHESFEFTSLALRKFAIAENIESKTKGDSQKQDFLELLFADGFATDALDVQTNGVGAYVYGCLFLT